MPPVPQTPSQTVGPYFAYGLTPEQYGYDFKSLVNNYLVSNSTDDQVIKITGQVFDGDHNVIPDAMIEFWQFDGETWKIGRHGTGTAMDHRFEFFMQKPKSVNGQAPSIPVIVFMRGQLIHAYTRIYFEDEAILNASDEVIQSVPPARRHTLIAHKNEDGYEFNIHMQGEHETVFFAI